MLQKNPQYILNTEQPMLSELSIGLHFLKQGYAIPKAGQCDIYRPVSLNTWLRVNTHESLCLCLSLGLLKTGIKIFLIQPGQGLSSPWEYLVSNYRTDLQATLAIQNK